ncbi:MAG: phosphotyrosine protein phosphatase [Gammaproteobacteria bacterium]
MAERTDILRILFICTQNMLRSPTGEQIYTGVEGIEARSAGISPDAIEVITLDLLLWADKIFVMEERHRLFLEQSFADAAVAKEIICLGIPDIYDYMDSALVRLLRERVTPHLG